jgi:hypothetical protein
MNDFEKLEKELSSFSPRLPTDEFTKKIEDALGEAGSVAMCHLNEQGEQSIAKPSFSKILAWTIPGIGIAATVAFFFYLLPLKPDEVTFKMGEVIPLQPLSIVEDSDSPLHGVSTEQLEDFSGMPMVGWLDPQTEEKFIRRVDEGIVDRATGLPARQYRYHFVDETIWTHPGSETRVLFTTPRQEVYLIDLELY